MRKFSTMFFILTGLLMFIFSGCEKKTTQLIPLESISFTIEELDLVVNTSEQLQILFIPQNSSDQRLYWNSSNNDIAIVSSDGVVTALKSGTTTITATSLDGSHVASCILLSIENIFTITTAEQWYEAVDIVKNNGD